MSYHLSDEVSYHLCDEVSYHLSDEVSYNLSDEVSYHMSDGVSYHLFDKVSYPLSDEVSYHLSDEVSYHLSDEVSYQLCDKVSYHCLTKCPITCVTRCPITCVTKCPITCVTKCPIFQEDPLYSRRSSSRIADLYSRPYDGATTWPSYWRRYGDRRDVVTSYDQRKRSRLSRQRGYSVYSGYNGSLRPMTSSWYGGWGYDGRAKRKHPYVTAPGRYPMPYVYPMAYYMPHTYAATPSPMYY